MCHKSKTINLQEGIGVKVRDVLIPDMRDMVVMSLSVVCDVTSCTVKLCLLHNPTFSATFFSPFFTPLRESPNTAHPASP